MIWIAVAPLYEAAAGVTALRRENCHLHAAGRSLLLGIVDRDAEIAELRPRAAMADEALETLDEVYGRMREAADQLGLRGTTRRGAE